MSNLGKKGSLTAPRTEGWTKSCCLYIDFWARRNDCMMLHVVRYQDKRENKQRGLDVNLELLYFIQSWPILLVFY